MTQANFQNDHLISDRLTNRQLPTASAGEKIKTENIPESMSPMSKVNLSDRTTKQEAPQEILLMAMAMGRQRNEDFLRNLKLTTVDSQ